MWKQREREISEESTATYHRKSRRRSRTPPRRKSPQHTRPHTRSPTLRQPDLGLGFVDEDDAGRAYFESYHAAPKARSTYWTRKLVEMEERDGQRFIAENYWSLYDRWGHAGYKELHPEEFDQPKKSVIRSQIIMLCFFYSACFVQSVHLGVSCCDVLLGQHCLHYRFSEQPLTSSE